MLCDEAKHCLMSEPVAGVSNISLTENALNGTVSIFGAYLFKDLMCATSFKSPVDSTVRSREKCSSIH